MATNRTIPEELKYFGGRIVVELLEPPDEFITTIFVCINTIITPLLRVYTPTFAHRLYDSLVQQKNINTQCYPDVLREYNGYQFKYVYINGNKEINNLMQFDPKWDYRVVGAVDLTKLMLWKNKYNQFSECDYCQLCDIITMINLSPSDVITKIEKLRRDRNSVAHSKTDEWNEKKFFTSLDEMTDLIDALGIPAGEQIAEIKKIKEGSICIRRINGIAVKVTCKIQRGGSAHVATIHGFSDQQEKQTLERLETEDHFNHDLSYFGIKATKNQPIKLDLRSDTAIYHSTYSFKLAVYELLGRVITASGVTEKEDVGIGIEFLLPDNLTKEQLLVVAESFPGALEKKQEKDILDYENMKTETQHWKNIRQKTSPMLKRIEDKLTRAAEDLATVGWRGYVVFGLSLVGAVLTLPFTGGVNLATACVLIWIFAKYLTQEIMKNSQEAIDTDIQTTLSFFERTKRLANQNNRYAVRFLETFPNCILADLEFSLKKFLERTIESTASIIKTRDNVKRLRKDLESELRRVDEIERRTSLDIYY